MSDATAAQREARRKTVIEMLIPEVRQDCTCLMFDKGPHRKGCSTWERAVNLADDILLVAFPSPTS